MGEDTDLTGATVGRTPTWETAYREFFVARQHALMRTAYAILGSWPAAEDAVQTAFAELYVRWPRIEPGAVDTYAWRTVTHTCFRMARRSNRERPADGVPEQQVPGPEAGLGRLDLVRALGLLSPEDRAVIALRFLDDLPVTEVARVLDLPEGTVKSRTSRALARLHAVLSPPQSTEREVP